MRMQFGKLARHRRVACLAVALLAFAALGVSVGAAQAGTSATSAQSRAAAARVLSGNRVVSSVAAAAVITPVEPCAALGQADFSTISGASTTIVSAAPVSASSNTLGDYAGCEVNGLIAPQIQFQLILPTQNYQGKYLQLGCGGYCGTDTLSAPAASYGCVPVTTGQFAEATDNEGHSGAVFSGAFAADLNLRVDFGYASEHALAVAAKAIIAAFYGHRPAESYYDGCSQGGHEALLEAQRYPADFNGIIAGAPASILTPLNIFYQGWNTLANTGPGGQPILTAADLPPLHAAVVKACDALDGTKDGLIADPFACHWNPRTIQCAPGQTSTAADFCLTAAQVTTVNKLYDGPTNSRGQLLYPGWELRGSEDNWTPWIVPPGGPESGSIDWGIATQTIKYLMGSTADPDLTINDIQFTTAYFTKLMNETAGIYDATDPDLTAFRNDGGKLILWQGLADPAISPVGTIAYYQAVQNYMGGPAATQEFARLFMLPGVSHCGGGDGPDSFNGLGALVNWVQNGQAPASLITSKVVNGAVTQTRPVYQYPLIAVDTTGGPITEASSYTPQQPPVHFNANVKWAGTFAAGYEQVCGWAGGAWVCRPGKAGPP
jgi:Tannase and feruloyl esterase